MDKETYTKKLTEIKFRCECIKDECNNIVIDSREHITPEAILRLDELNEVLQDLVKQAESIQDSYEISRIQNTKQ